MRNFRHRSIFTRRTVAALIGLGLIAWAAAAWLLIRQPVGAGSAVIAALAVLGAGLVATGGIGLVLYLRSGPHEDRTANLFWHLVRAFVLTWHRLESRGHDNIPATGAVILAPNHTTGLDPLLIQAPCHRAIRWLMFTSYRFRLLEPLWRAIRPITLDLKSSDTVKVRQVVQALESGDIVGLFPEGSLQRTQRELQPFKPGIGMIARRSGAAVVPVWIEGTPRRQNMLWHFLQPSRSRVTFGKSYVPDPAWSAKEVMADLRRRMEELSEMTHDPQ